MGTKDSDVQKYGCLEKEKEIDLEKKRKGCTKIMVVWLCPINVWKEHSPTLCQTDVF